MADDPAVGRPAGNLSIFAQSLDRAAFVAYFLGAVVPLLALGWVVNEEVLPRLEDGLASAGLVGLVLSLGLLSAGAFLLLRRVTFTALASMRTDNERLEALLGASAELASVAHETDLASAAAACALRITGAEAAFWITAPDGTPPKLHATAGARALWPTVEVRLADALPAAQESGRPVVWNGPEAGALVPVAGAGALAVVARAGRAIDPSSLGPLATLAAQSASAAARAQLQSAQRNFFVHVTDILVAALDTHMDRQAGHARRVAQLANRIGRELGLSDERRQRLHFAALLHDVGMLRIERTRQSDVRALRQHPALGHRMLAPIALWADVAPFVLHHHECWDGGGYPEQLAGDAIPLEARIIGLAEAFDGMTNPASHQPPVLPEEAVRRIEAGSGTQFDPELVRVFLALARRGDLDLS